MGLLFLFKKKPLFDKSPHEIFPEIMHWRIGDEIESCSSGTTSYYKGTNERGVVFMESILYGMHEVDIKKLSERYYNKSLQNRKIKDNMKSTKEYMQLMKDFQKAYNEIKDQ